MALCGLRAGSGTAVLLFRSHLYVGTERSVAPRYLQKGKGELPKRVENRRLSTLLGPARERRSPAVRRRRNSPARKRRIANATRVHHEKGAGKWAAARKRRIAYATRLHRKTAAEEWPAARFIAAARSHAVCRPHRAAAGWRQTSVPPYRGSAGPPSRRAQTAGRSDTGFQCTGR